MNNYKLGDLVFHSADAAPFKVVGIRENEIEIKGDWSGGIVKCDATSWVAYSEIQPFDYSKMKIYKQKLFNMQNQFVNTSYEPLPENEFVVGYNPNWVHEDFNKEGIRFGYSTPEKTFVCSIYNHEHECFDSAEIEGDEYPVLWMKIKIPLLIPEYGFILKDN